MLALLVVLAVAVGVAAVMPQEVAGTPERWIEAGSAEDFPPNTITSFPLGPVDPPAAALVHIVRRGDGGLTVIAGRDPMGCSVPWRPHFRFDGTEGWFRDPCRGSTYDAEGRRVFGPSPRDLDRLAFEVAPSGTLRVEVAHPIQEPIGGWAR